MKSHKERIEYLKSAVREADENKSENTYKIKSWRGEPKWLKLIRVDVDYLMYRIENARTIRQQMRYLRNNPELPKTLFEDPETSKAQEAQKQILLDMIKATGKDFMEDLNFHGQEDAVIVTYDGYIVNGNRRVAALRDLGERYIDCVVLPENTTPKDIYELEQELQISETFKEDYHWINELANISQGVKDKRFNYSEKEMANRLRLNETELRARLRMMELVDAFLIWKGIPKEYDYMKLDDAEQVFTQMEKALRAKKYSNDVNKSQELMNAIFTLVEQRPTEERLYVHVMGLIKNFDQVYEKMSEEIYNNNGSEIQLETTSGENGDVIDDLLVGEASTDEDIFGDSENASDLSPVLVETIADVKAENVEKKEAETVYKGVSSALRSLQGLVIEENTIELTGISNKLNQIIKVVNELMSQIEGKQD